MEPDKGIQWRCYYLLGVLCASTDRHQECESIMERLKANGSGDHAGVSYYLGMSNKKLNKRSAGKHFQAAYQQNPALFVAYQEATHIDPEIDVNPYKALLQSVGGANRAAAAAQHEDPRSSAGLTRRTASASSLTNTRPSAAAHQQPASATQRHGPSPIPIRPTTEALRHTEAGIGALWALLKPIADAVRGLNSYRCTEALALITSPNMPHPHSNFVQTLAALAAFHSGQMYECAQFFANARTVDPWKLNDESLVFYSTALWHLHDEARLAALSQQMIASLPMSSITLCIVGNCYSLIRETKAALMMFQRACQVNPFHAYARTLRGYELLANDQAEEAQPEFLEAIRLDARLYTAYAGLGNIRFQLGEDDKARQYYILALKINPLVTIYNCLARTYARENVSEDSLQMALNYYDQGLARNPKHFAARHQRALVLMRLNRMEAAFIELDGLCSEPPHEAMAFIDLGRCLAKLGRRPQAMNAFHRAMDLDPRKAPMVKDLLDRLSTAS
jgi:tetratricopeptide (TPR) repeat protein